MIGTVLKNELRSMLRDPLYLFFALYPAILGTAGYFIIDYMKGTTATPWPELVAMFLILITGYIFGALTAFTLLDDKDDKVLMSLKITPIDVKFYVYVKLAVSYIFGFIATIVLIYATNFMPNSNFGVILLISLVSALQAPGVALIVNSFSDNKVEGFVYMKMTGLILIVPALAMFYQAWQEVFFVIAPGFWSARLIQIELLPQVETNFTFIVYLLAGIIYNLLFIYVFMKIYAKRANL